MPEYLTKYHIDHNFKRLKLLGELIVSLCGAFVCLLFFLGEGKEKGGDREEPRSEVKLLCDYECYNQPCKTLVSFK